MSLESTEAAKVLVKKLDWLCLDDQTQGGKNKQGKRDRRWPPNLRNKELRELNKHKPDSSKIINNKPDTVVHFILLTIVLVSYGKG